MLYALWCLWDVERVEQLEHRAERVADGFTVNHAMNAPRELERARELVLREMRRGPRLESVPTFDPAVLSFPGMPHYKGPRPDRPTNVVRDRSRRVKPS